MFGVRVLALRAQRVDEPSTTPEPFFTITRGFLPVDRLGLAGTDHLQRHGAQRVHHNR